jgi:hypothetical protein
MITFIKARNITKEMNMRKIITIHPIYLFFQIMLLFSNLSICEGAWIIQEVDSLPDVGRINSLTIDKNGNVHVVYLNPDTTAGAILKHAYTKSGSGWIIEKITQAWGDLGISVDNSNIIHVISLNQAQWDLKYTNSDGNGIINNVISNSGSWVYNHSIALNNNIPMISANQFCTNTGGCFAGDSTYTSHLYYITISGGVFQFEKVDGGIPGISGSGEFGKSNAIASDLSGNPHIVYDVLLNGTRTIAYARKDTSGWKKYWVDNNIQTVKGIYLKNAVDLTGKIHIGYYDITNEKLIYATGNDSIWEIEVVDNTASVGEYLSLAIDKNNLPSFSYYDRTNMRLKYAYKDSGNIWHYEIVDQSAAVDLGKYSSIAIDRNNQPIITYYDSLKRVVKIAYRDDADLDSDGIPDRFDVYQNNPDSNGNSILDGIDPNIPTRINRIPATPDGDGSGGGSSGGGTTGSLSPLGCSTIPESRNDPWGGVATGITVGLLMIVLEIRRRLAKRSNRK